MERIDREVKRLLQLDRLCKETTGKDVFWEEVYEGGVHPALKTDVAQMSDLDDFAAEDENGELQLIFGACYALIKNKADCTGMLLYHFTQLLCIPSSNPAPSAST